MISAKDTQSSLLLGEALRPGLDALAYLIQTTQTQGSDYGFFSHLCNFVVPFIRKTAALQGLRDEWANEYSKHIKDTRSLQQATVEEVSEACQILKARLKKSTVKVRNDSLKALDDVEKILTTGGPYLGPAFYETAADRLSDLCCTLAAYGQGDLLAGIGDVAYRETSSFEDGKVKQRQEPYLAAVHFKTSIAALWNRSKVMDWDRVDNPWAVYEYLCLAEQCWHLPLSYFDALPISMGSASNVQRSNHVFNLRGYWWDMQGIRQRHKSDRAPIPFTRKRYSTYLEHLSSAIVAFHGLSNMSAAETFSPIHALELKLDHNELHLVVEWQQEGETSTFLLHACQEDSLPLRFLQELFRKQGKKVVLEDKDGQSAAKLLTALRLVGPLRNLFLSKGQTHSATLARTRVVLSQVSGVDPIKITQYINSLGLKQLEGAFSRINYEQYQKVNS